MDTKLFEALFEGTSGAVVYVNKEGFTRFMFVEPLDIIEMAEYTAMILISIRRVVAELNEEHPNFAQALEVMLKAQD